MADRLENYSKVLEPLVSEAIACSPESWTEGTLTIECDGSYMSYKLKNERSPDKAEISDLLRGLCEEFYVVMRSAGDIWQAAVVHFFRKDQGWSFKVKFEYSGIASNQKTAAQPATTKKPLWKFWR